MTSVSDRIIDALGGTTVVARRSETPLSTVHSWRRNGIPRSRLAHLKLIAANEGIEINWETGEVVEENDVDHAASDTTGGDGSSPDISAQNIARVTA